MSSSRQKSCIACARSKRRCDQEFPKCRRCFAKKIECEYNSRNLDRLQQNSDRYGDQEVGPAEMFVGEMSGDVQLQRSPALMGAGGLPGLNDAFLEFENNPFALSGLPGEEIVSSNVIEEIVAQQQLDDISQITSNTRLHACVDFVAKRLAGIPKTFAERGQTMFIHRQLLQNRSSPALDEALSACALYCLKNVDNQALVFRNLRQKAQQLIATTDPLLASKADLLAALQALLLYQVIGLFDGDIRLRAQAEAEQPTLIAWAEVLKSRMRQKLLPLTAPAALPTPQKRTAQWQRWLVEESSQRAVIAAFMLKGVYNFLKLGYDENPNQELSFTAQVALWDAQSEFAWWMAQRDRK